VPAKLRDIEAFCNKYTLKLPPAYIQFLLKHNGGKPTPAAFPIKGFPQNPFGAIQAFFGIRATISTEDLENLMLEFEGTFPKDLLPIACTGTGDYLCIDLRNSRGKIVFWDFHPFWGNNIWSENHLYDVASDFAALLDSINNPEN
jgi:hypothetical protein